MQESTLLTHLGRDPKRFGGLVNVPICRGSTVLSSTVAQWQQRIADRAADVPGAMTYGRFGTPTHHALEDAVAQLEGGHRARLFPSGLAAIVTVLTGLLKQGDHVLLTDSAYGPTRVFLERVLSRFGVELSLYDPSLGGGIESQFKPNTRLVYVESPGSNTFEVQDVPAIAAAARRRGAWVVMDNTWATPLFFKPLAHGVDVSIQAATKYIVGHSDALLGVATCTERAWPLVKQAADDLGQVAGPDEAYLALRGLRSMGVRLQRHFDAGLEVARWLQRHEAIETVLHPALPSHPTHALWQRDFQGASGLFAVVLKSESARDLHGFIDALQLFGLGVSWGGFESLVVPVQPTGDHLARRWPWKGQALRLHVGLEDPRDLIADLASALSKITSRHLQTA